MSGTSLDGLDLALCEFKVKNSTYNYKLIKTTTITYSKEWKNKLKNATTLKAEDYFKLHAAYGKFIGTEIHSFIKGIKQKVNLIGSHGHTVFHQPYNGFTTQIGCGATIAAITNTTTICDFRSLDVALKGQGAPLVPIGDKLLFYKHSACLNIGGIANISVTKNNKTLAFDICPANMALNYLAEKLALEYDKDGEIAASNNVDKLLLKKLNALPFYKKTGAKSLGKEWFDTNFLPLISNSNHIETIVATVTEHVAWIIAQQLNKLKLKNVLITGGGAFNKHLIKRIKAYTECKMEIPSKEIVAYKEAIIFAFLGFLRCRGEVNALKSVTGALKNNAGGAIYFL